MAQGRPYQAYQNTSVNTSSQKQLIIMLFDGMTKFTNQAIKAIEEEDFESAHSGLHRTGKILLELMSTLREDKGGEVALNLKKVYLFCYEQIVISNLKKDVEMIKEVQGILVTISEGFREIAKAGRTTNIAGAPQSIKITG